MRFIPLAVLACALLSATATLSAKPTEEKLKQDITSELLKLVDQAPDNFPNISALQEAYADPDKVVSLATPRPALHANLYFVSEIKETKRRGYTAQYQGVEAVRRVTAVVQALPATGGPRWTLEGEPGTGPTKWQIDCRRDGRVCANLLVNPADNTAFLSVTIFATPVTDPAEIVKQIDDLIVASKRDFEGTSRSAYLDPAPHYGSHAVPALMHSNEAFLYISEQYYPTLFIKWYDATPGSQFIRTTVYAHLDQLVASGKAKKALDTRDPKGGGKLFIKIDNVDLEFGLDDAENKPGSQLQIGRSGAKPNYAANFGPRTHSFTDYGNSAPSRSSAPVTHDHICVRCDGRTRIETTDRYGNHVSVTCPICHGTGHVTF